MASAFKTTGGAGLLSIYANETTKDIANNRSLVEWSFWLKENSSSPTTWYGSPIPASVNVGSGSVVEWEGTFNLDWRGSGLSDQKIASGATWVGHLDDGSLPSLGVAGSIGDTHTAGAGGPTTVTVTLALTTLHRGPRVRHSGEWKHSVAYVRQGGTWKVAVPYVRQGGVWKVAGG